MRRVAWLIDGCHAGQRESSLGIIALEEVGLSRNVTIVIPFLLITKLISQSLFICPICGSLCYSAGYLAEFFSVAGITFRNDGTDSKASFTLIGPTDYKVVVSCDFKGHDRSFLVAIDPSVRLSTLNKLLRRLEHERAGKQIASSR